jgi:hypothetical protein
MPDTKNSLIDNFNARQLSELLALGTNLPETATDWLLDVGDWERLEALLTDMSTGEEQSGTALLETVSSPDTTLEMLVVVKDIAKRLATKAKDKPQKAAATLLYHLSVAAALGHCGQTISSRDPAEQLPLYGELAEELSDDELAAVFARAIGRIRSTQP